MKHFKTALLVLALSFLGTGVLGLQTPRAGALPATVSSVSGLKSDACAGLNQVDSTQGCGTNGTAFGKIVQTVVTILSYIIGIAAVIMIIVSGFKYITSGGDSGKVSSAKSTLIYALIGLFIVALAQGLVHWALHKANQAISESDGSVIQLIYKADV